MPAKIRRSFEGLTKSLQLSPASLDFNLIDDVVPVVNLMTLSAAPPVYAHVQIAGGTTFASLPIVAGEYDATISISINQATVTVVQYDFQFGPDFSGLGDPETRFKRILHSNGVSSFSFSLRFSSSFNFRIFTQSGGSVSDIGQLDAVLVMR